MYDLFRSVQSVRLNRARPWTHGFFRLFARTNETRALAPSFHHAENLTPDLCAFPSLRRLRRELAELRTKFWLASACFAYARATMCV